jgi:predicted histidine transporter YuiF (NhaC family)
MTIALDTIFTIARIIGALGVILGLVFAIYRWYLKQNKQNAEIDQIKEENALIYYSLSACLDGLIQLGCNHSVTEAKDKLDKYINKQAHK